MACCPPARRISERQAALAFAYAVGGRTGEALGIVAELAAQPGGMGNSYHIATIHTGLADRQQALRWLDRAWRERDGMLANRVKLDPKLEVVRQESRFRDLLKRMFPDD